MKYSLDYRGPSPARSRDILRMIGIGERDESKRREKEADISWFTQKAKKVPDTGLALFMEASGALSMGWKHRALSREGLRSPGRKVNSEGLCAPGHQPEKRERERERKRERKNDTGRPSSDEVRSAALFSKGAFIPWVTHIQKWKTQSHAESVQHYINLNCIPFHL